MRRYSLITLLGFAAAGVASGYGLERRTASERPRSTAADEAAPAASAAAPHRSRPARSRPQPPAFAAGATSEPSPSGEGLFERVARMDPAHPDFELLRALNRQLADDPGLRADLMRRYAGASDQQTREMLKDALAGVGTRDVVDFTLRLARGGDLAQRKDGLDMLANLPPSPEAYAVASEVVQSGADPGVLSRAVNALHPPALPAAAESEAMATRLAALARHEDPELRESSLRMLPYWDRNGRQTEALALQGLSDSSPGVRQAAIGAVTSLGAQGRSDPLKSALLEVLRNPAEDPAIKKGALTALGRFTLSASEHALYTQAAAELPGA
jgi:hypothetical protein